MAKNILLDKRHAFLSLFLLCHQQPSTTNHTQAQADTPHPIFLLPCNRRYSLPHYNDDTLHHLPMGENLCLLPNRALQSSETLLRVWLSHALDTLLARLGNYVQYGSLHLSDLPKKVICLGSKAA